MFLLPGLLSEILKLRLQILNPIDKSLLIDLTSLVFLLQELFPFFFKQIDLLMILIFHGVDDFSFQRKLFLANPLQKFLFFDNVLINCLYFLLRFIFLSIEVILMLDYHLVLLGVVFFYDLLYLLFILLVLLCMFLKDLGISQF